MKRVFALGLAAGLAALAGCGGGPRIAPVSGVVKVNGRPVKGLVVSFQPVGAADAPNPGRGSSGVTDENGRYTLVYDGEEPGAVVGKHRVRIFAQEGGAELPDTEGDPEATQKARPGRRPQVVIPPEWHDLSTKEFEVPPSGTDQANFDIEARRPGR